MSNNYPNYRVSVEIVVKEDNKILLSKRAACSKVAPNVWTVPAGKVKYDEIPVDAVIREAKEETALNVKIIKELNCRAVKIKSGNEDAYRLLYTYLVEKVNSNDDVKINEEHSEFLWVSKEDLESGKYDTDSLFSCIPILIDKAFD